MDFKLSYGQLLILLVFLCSIGIFLRPTLFGYDSYAHLNAIQFGDFERLSGQGQYFSNIVMGWLPNNLFLIKFLMFVSLFVSCAGFFRLANNLYSKKVALLTVFVLLSLSPLLLFNFGKFENEVFAFPFLVWFIVFLFERKWVKSFLFGVFGTCFWVWPYYLLGFFGLVFNFSWLGESFAIESRLFGGLLDFWLLIPFVFSIFLVKDRRVLFFGLISVVLVLVHAKLFLFLYCFLVFGIGLVIQKLLEKPEWLNYLLLACFFSIIGLNIAFLLQSPTSSDWFFVDEAIRISVDENIPLYNDMGQGYWIKNKGFYTPFDGGFGSPDYDSLEPPFVALTKTDLNCEIVLEKTFLARNLKIFKC